MSSEPQPTSTNTNKGCGPGGRDPAALALLQSLKKDPTGCGFTHLGSDGVLRAVDKARNIVDYRQLSPEEIKIFFTMYPPHLRGEFEEKFAGVDGRLVVDEEQLLHPNESILPPPPPPREEGDERGEGGAVTRASGSDYEGSR